MRLRNRNNTVGIVITTYSSGILAHAAKRTSSFNLGAAGCGGANV